MIEALNTASEDLHVALERYFSVCSTIQTNCYASGNQINGAVQALSERIDKELLLADSYRTKLEQAKAAMSLSRNSFGRVVPINRLSSEILAHIFDLVLSMQHCSAESNRMRFPKYPDLLSHVCSRWREIAISSCTLWSHIDLAPCHSLHQGLLARAAVYADRAGRLPLSLHVITLEYQVEYTIHVRNTLEEFLASVSTRVRSLEIVLGGGSTAEESVTDITIVESCLRDHVPGMLTQFTVTNHSSKLLRFLLPKDFELIIPDSPPLVIPDSFPLVPLSLPHEFLEDIWGPVTSLRLDGLYPYWTSQAYHGLVELHLTSHRTSQILPITESQLVNILRSSSRLRILEFGLFVTEALPLDTSVTSVHLNELEVLIVNTMDYRQLEFVLRWLSPGSIPLQLSITVSYSTNLLTLSTELIAFFARSRSSIAKFYLSVISTEFSVIHKLLGLLPNLRALTIEGCLVMPGNAGGRGSADTDGGNTLTLAFRLDHLHFLRCSVNVDALLKFVERDPVRKITFDQYAFIGRQDTYHPREVRNELYKFCPIVELDEKGMDIW